MVTQHSFFGDIISLTKPKITTMAVLVAGAGLLHAGRDITVAKSLLSLLGIAALVSGSSALNMYLEREQDRKMLRTKDRPLPAQRLHAMWAIGMGVFCVGLAGLLLYDQANWWTLSLGIVSSVLYVGLYTPLKQKTWLSLIVGSVPGAMPVALGYLSLAGQIDSKMWALFSWAFLWQIPHFLAISLFREEEYTAAGYPVLSKIGGEMIAKWLLLITSWMLAFSTLGLYLTQIISQNLLIVCLMLGMWFLYTCHRGCFSEETDIWARRAFKASLVYQSALFIILIFAAIY